MGLLPVRCPHCHSDQVIKGGKTEAGKQRYKCQNVDGGRYAFPLELPDTGLSPEVKAPIVDMARRGSGIRETARVLQVSPTTVMHALKKKRRRSAG